MIEYYEPSLLGHASSGVFLLAVRRRAKASPGDTLRIQWPKGDNGGPCRVAGLSGPQPRSPFPSSSGILASLLQSARPSSPPGDQSEN
jgi:hypothetical protein